MTCRHDSNRSELFGFPKSQLLPIAECVAGMSVRNFDISIDTIDAEVGTDEYGGCGEKCIVTFTCTGTYGRERRERVFAKLADHGHEESIHYEYLARHNAPIPKTYGTLETEDGRELVFTEYLEPILTWDDWNSPETHLEFLSTIAQINAITPSDRLNAPGVSAAIPGVLCPVGRPDRLGGTTSRRDFAHRPRSKNPLAVADVFGLG